MSVYPESQLDRLSELIASRTGLNTFESHRHQLIAVLTQEAIVDIEQYLDYLRLLNDSHPIWQALLAELTIGETYFMRDTEQINVLRHHLLPGLIHERRQNSNFTLNLWSAGCATGEEAYTLAILLHQLLPDLAAWEINITGSDINLGVLEIARQGVYRSWSFRNSDDNFKQTYFVRHGADQFKIHPEIRSMVRFRHDNLVQSYLRAQDLIICRNVLIYFTRQQTTIAERSLTDSLINGGWLMLGPVETLKHVRPQYAIRQIDNTIVFHKQSSQLASIGTAKTPHVPATTTDRYQEAVDAFHSGQILKAEQLLTIASTTIGIEKVNTLKASIEIARGNLKQARHLLQQVLHDNPFVSDAHYLMALLELESDDAVAARTCLRAALYCLPQHSLALLLSGDVHMRAGQFDRAAHDWAMARDSVSDMAPETYLSSVADVTAGQLTMLVNHRLK